MKIEVTEANIKNGRKASCTHDPIALSMKDKGLEKVWASPSYLSWWKNLKVYCVGAPESVLLFMKQFDNGELVHPFEFDLEV